MVLEDWYAYIESVPLTDSQLVRIILEFQRLGFRDREDRRSERLAITAELAGLEELGSANDLTQGQAGRVIWALQQCPDLSGLELPGVAADAEPGVPERVSLHQALTQLAAAWRAARRDPLPTGIR